MPSQNTHSRQHSSHQPSPHKVHHHQHRQHHQHPQNHRAHHIEHMYHNNRYQSWPDRQDASRNQPQHPYHHSAEDDYLPPYIKKYNRRNKQLINLLEGTVAPSKDSSNRQVYYAKVRSVHQRRKHHHHHHSDQKSAKWLEANMFEDQRPQLMVNQSAAPIAKSPNDLPGENKVNPRADLMDSEELVFSADIQDSAARSAVKTDSETTVRPAAPPPTSRVDHFQFHRVASPRLVGAGSFGLLHKQRLPFVAITDRRPSHPNVGQTSQ